MIVNSELVSPSKKEDVCSGLSKRVPLASYTCHSPNFNEHHSWEEGSSSAVNETLTARESKVIDKDYNYLGSFQDIPFADPHPPHTQPVGYKTTHSQVLL